MKIYQVLSFVQLSFIFLFTTSVWAWEFKSNNSTKTQHAKLLLKPVKPGESSLSIIGNQCSSGIYFKSPEAFSCYCLTGMWAFYSSWCTVPVTIVAGINYCQELNAMELTQVSLLSSKQDPASPTLTRVSANMYQLREIIYQDSAVNWTTGDSSFITSGVGNGNNQTGMEFDGWLITTVPNGEQYCLVHNEKESTGAMEEQNSTYIPFYCLFNQIGDYQVNYTEIGCRGRNFTGETIKPVYCTMFFMGNGAGHPTCFNDAASLKTIDISSQDEDDIKRLKRQDVDELQLLEPIPTLLNGYESQLAKAAVVRSAEAEGDSKAAEAAVLSEHEEAELNLNREKFKRKFKKDSTRARDEMEKQASAMEKPTENDDTTTENDSSTTEESSSSEDSSSDPTEVDYVISNLDGDFTTGPVIDTGAPQYTTTGSIEGLEIYTGDPDPGLGFTPDSNPYTGAPDSDYMMNPGVTLMPPDFYTPDSKSYTGPMEGASSDSNPYTGQPMDDYGMSAGFRSGGRSGNSGDGDDDECESTNNFHSQSVQNSPLILSHLGSHVELKIGQIVGNRNKVGIPKKWPAVRLLQQMLELMTKTCRSVSTDYLEMAMDTFVNLQIHSFHIKEPFIPHPTFYRIEKAMESCLMIAKPHEFVVDEKVTASRLPVGTTCENQLQPSSNIIKRNGKKVELEMPEDRRANGFEPIIETIWKILVNSHSYCYKWFSDYFNDHHAFTVFLMPFFNNEIQKLWMPIRLNGTYSEPPQNAHLYGSLIGDHKLILTDIDNCVGASRVGSSYPWHMSRPPRDETNQWRRRRKRRSIEKLSTNKFCLNSPDDPIQLFSLQKCER